MDRLQHMRDAYERLNNRDFGGRDGFAEDVRWHAPGVGVDTLVGMEAITEKLRLLIEPAAVHYEVVDTAELGPFAVGYVRSEGKVNGETRSWEVLQVALWDGDQVTEMWSLRA